MKRVSLCHSVSSPSSPTTVIGIRRLSGLLSAWPSDVAPMKTAVDASLNTPAHRRVADERIAEHDLGRYRCSLRVVGWIRVPRLTTVGCLRRLVRTDQLQPPGCAYEGGCAGGIWSVFRVAPRGTPIRGLEYIACLLYT